MTGLPCVPGRVVLTFEVLVLGPVLIPRWDSVRHNVPLAKRCGKSRLQRTQGQRVEVVIDQELAPCPHAIASQRYKVIHVADFDDKLPPRWVV